MTDLGLTKYLTEWIFCHIFAEAILNKINVQKTISNCSTVATATVMV